MEYPHWLMVAGAILVVPAGSPTLWRWSGSFHSLHIFLEPGLFARSRLR